MTDTGTIEFLTRRIETLEGEAEVRRLQARYMFLGDSPCPEFGVEDDAHRIDLIMDLYADDAEWEGVGEYYGNQFGKLVGREAIRSHFENFWSSGRGLVLNAHYLTSEHIRIDGDSAVGQWLHVQPWLFDDGRAVLRSSRLNNAFRKIDGTWKITRTRTENVLVAPLPSNFAESFPTASILMKP